jgi:lysophospholipase L1-like esterase
VRGAAIMSEGRTRSRQVLFTFVVFALVALVLEFAARLVFAALPDFERTRAALRGELGEDARFQRCVGQPYLLYVPTPSFEDEHGLQHNEDGYRGERVPVERSDGVARVLFLGGSTTYGWKVPAADESYPAQIGAQLREDLPEGANDVEVINAGLPWGTSAEMLTHYLFKFHYYQPDLVVIHTGANDASAMLATGYQPDYGHWRQPLVDMPRLSGFGRALLASRLASAVLVPAYSGLVPNRFSILRRGDAVASWYAGKQDALHIPESAYAFSHNLRRLIRAIRDDGKEVLLIPWRGQPNTHAEMIEVIDRNEMEVLRLAREEGVAVAPFPASVISEQNWGDRGHVNAAGAREKALHLLPYVRDGLAAARQRAGES